VTFNFVTVDKEINFAKDTKEGYVMIPAGIDDPAVAIPRIDPPGRNS
jgi:hypothetical protein